MHKSLSAFVRTFALVLMLSPVFAAPARAAASRQSFWGFSPGVEVISQSGSGSGFYIQVFGGYNFDSLVGVGLHGGYSSVGGVGIRFFDFGSFLQLTDPDSGLYGRFYLDGVNASVWGGGKIHGVDNTQLGFAPGVGLGMLIPAAGSFHLVGEVAYHAAFLESIVNMITPTFGVMWDF